MHLALSVGFITVLKSVLERAGCLYVSVGSVNVSHSSQST